VPQNWYRPGRYLTDQTGQMVYRWSASEGM
jgi:hypothetical protein